LFKSFAALSVVDGYELAYNLILRGGMLLLYFVDDGLNILYIYLYDISHG
jgi:hypothetical protein